MTPSLLVRPVEGLPEIRAGADLAELIASSAPDLADGDIVVVSSKVVSKAEGQVRSGVSRPDAVRDETVRVVAERGPTQIVQTRHGFVMAAAGIDNSNVQVGSLVLLPVDPDASARELRAGLAARLGVQVGVVVTDTFGRPWRLGQTDLAVGVAGVQVLDDHEGRVDPYGNALAVTAPAYADELAAAADVVKQKLTGVPVAVVRGAGFLVTADDGPGVAAVVRPAAEDMFRLGSREAVREAALRLAPPTFVDRPVDSTVLRRAVAEVTPEGAAWSVRELDDPPTRKALLDALSLPPSLPYVGVVTVAAGASPEILLDVGEWCARLAMLLAADGLGVVRVPDVSPVDALLPSGVDGVAVLAIGAVEPSA